ncbi:OmpA family protein [Nitratidesulfovibrio sp. 1201_IL3209]|uniref:OmpA family protein n=1 Tax=Nitratidesulfovibrio sp. 1201_IL3209 TaxID=3084053 RepID=UPI002FD9D3DC
MKIAKLLTLVAALMLVCAAPAFAAGQSTLVPKIASFDFFVDYSGSMMMSHEKVGKNKMELTKKLLSAINAKIPALGYEGGLHTFAPSTEIQPVAAWDKASYEKAIKKLNENEDTFARLTPMGTGLQKATYAKAMKRKAAMIMVSDGESNLGSDPVAEAKMLLSTNPGLCLHVISMADKPAGQATLDAIAKLNGCAVTAKGPELLANEAALDKFVRDVFYEEKAAPAAAAAPMDEVIVLRSIQFALNSAKLDATATSILVETASILKSKKGSIEVAGHTCSLGTDEYNQKLSEARAKSVKDFLVKQGVESSRLITKGYGESQPKYDNSTEETRKLNRRVELSFIK